MKVILEFYRAIYLRFELLFIKIEGDKNNARFSAILLISVFDVMMALLISMSFELNSINLISFENSEFGEILAFLAILPVAFFNWLLVGNAKTIESSRFVDKGKPNFVVDLFIIIIIVSLILVSGMLRPLN